MPELSRQNHPIGQRHEVKLREVIPKINLNLQLGRKRAVLISSVDVFNTFSSHTTRCVENTERVKSTSPETTEKTSCPKTTQEPVCNEDNEQKGRQEETKMMRRAPTYSGICSCRWKYGSDRLSVLCG